MGWIGWYDLRPSFLAVGLGALRVLTGHGGAPIGRGQSSQAALSRKFALLANRPGFGKDFTLDEAAGLEEANRAKVLNGLID